MKNILLINGHPDTTSYNYALHEAYRAGAEAAGYTVDELRLATLTFDLTLHAAYKDKQDLEPDLLLAQEKIRKADHIVWIFPVWWGTMPALLKGFTDRTLLPGFAFRYRRNSQLWDKLLAGKTTEIICTIDYPVWYFKWVLGSGGVKVMRKMVLDFCGLKTTRTTYIGPVRPSTAEQRAQWLKKANQLGRSAG